MQQNELGLASRSLERKRFPLAALFRSRNSFSLLTSLLLFLVLVYCCRLVLPGASSIELTLQIDHEDSIQIEHPFVHPTR